MKTNANELVTTSLEYVVDGKRKRGGLTKRELFAALAMQGFCSTIKSNPAHRNIASEAVKAADALIAELNKDKGE